DRVRFFYAVTHCTLASYVSDSMTERTSSSRKYGKGTLIYATDCALNCLAVNAKADLLATAGRNLFLVFSINADKLTPVPRLKTGNRFQATSGASTDSVSTSGSNGALSSTSTSVQTVQSPTESSAPRSHSVTDVSWSCADNVLATGSTNGAITLWDVGPAITRQKCFTGHSRSIHCINFHPINPWELVTASQDGTLKTFDTREPNPSSNPRIFIQRSTLPSPVRDVVYCPRNTYLFAAAQENGTVSIWDTRQQGRPYWAFQGHSCSIATVDWHPNWLGSGRNWLATAGSGDHLIKVWNFNQVASGQSGCPSIIYTVRTSNVSRVRWRPGFVSLHFSGLHFCSVAAPQYSVSGPVTGVMIIHSLC
ncbi:WD repeat-containing protein 24, partial [Paragonimus westermani]